MLGRWWTAEGWVSVGIMVTFIFTRTFIRWIRTHPATARCKHAENRNTGSEELALGSVGGWLDDFFLIEFQSGFGPNHSTEPACRLFNVRVNSDTAKESVGLLSHPSAAFDAVGQNIDLNRGETWPPWLCLLTLPLRGVLQNAKVAYHGYTEDRHVYLTFPQTTWVQSSPRTTPES